MNDVQARLYYETKCKNCVFYEKEKKTTGIRLVHQGKT